MVAFADELWSGVSVVAAPSVEQEHGLDHAGYTLFVFTLPMLGSAIVDVGVAWLSDRFPRRAVVASALGALAIALGASAFAPSAPLFALMLALAGTASGAATGAAQGELINLNDGNATRAMTRWNAFAAGGDLCAPLVVAAVLAAGATFRGAMLAVAALVAMQALAMSRGPDARSPAQGATSKAADAVDADDDASMPLRQAWAIGARDRELWIALAATATCTLLDEIVTALAALRAERDLATSPAFATACLTSLAAGAVVGAIATDVAARRTSSSRILVASALSSLVALAVVATTTSTWGFLVALALLGLTSVPHYPLLKARAYERAPGTPGLVNALDQIFVVSEIGIPLALGWVADRFGLSVALGLLGIQPLVVLAVTVRRPRADRGPRSEA